ncbi:MAG: hypothetical protein WKF79_14075, partial [Nocardioides sp.]
MISTSDLDAAATLAALETGVRRRRRAEVDDLLLVLHWADLHGADPQQEAKAQGRRLPPGSNRLDLVGGEGTPGVQDLAVCELGIARSVHTLAARAVVADALDLRHRLPHIWARVLDLDAEAWLARKAAVMCRHLSYDTVRIVDWAVADAITGQAPSRVLELAAAKIIEADQATHQARLEAQLHQRFVGLTRRNDTGLRTIIAKITEGDAHWVETLIDQIADALAPRVELEGLGRDELRAEAFAWLARPEDIITLLDTNQTQPQTQPQPTKPRQRATLYLHLHQAALHGPGVARVEGLSGHTLTQLRRLLAHTHLAIKPVIDLTEQVSVNAYEFPETIKERIALARPEDRFPHASRITRHLDLDHPIAYHAQGPPGQTSTRTGQPLSRTAHRAKTHLAYTSTPTETGETIWSTPHGRHRIVDHTGTHIIEQEEAEAMLSNDPLDRALTRIWHQHKTGQLGPSVTT